MLAERFMRSNRNIEIKLRCVDLDAIRTRAMALGASVEGELIQTDTYFGVPHGRLKLRQTEGRPAQLIRYDRPDAAHARASDYSIEIVADPSAELSRLEGELGVRAVIHKRRELLLWRNVRIHLDRVENLGTFVELESVVGPEVDEPSARRAFEELFALLGLRLSDAEQGSYAKLLRR